MNDAELNARLMVHTDGTAGPYLMVPVQQLTEVEKALKEADIRFSVSRDAIQLSGKDAIAIIDFGRRADASVIQAALDAH